MSNMMGGGDDPMMPNGGQSEIVEENEESVQGSVEGKPRLKRRRWTREEDKILSDYIDEYGAKKWNDVPKKSDIARTGHSCRFRWINYLKPVFRKGAFTDEEKQKIAKMHEQWGNKWSQMAQQLPGHTNIEIKNYWNARVKRRERDGLPIYSPDVEQQRHHQENPNVSSSISAANQHNSPKHHAYDPRNSPKQPIIHYNGSGYWISWYYPATPHHL